MEITKLYHEILTNRRTVYEILYPTIEFSITAIEFHSALV